MVPEEKQATPQVAFVFLGPLTNERVSAGNLSLRNPPKRVDAALISAYDGK